MVKDSLVTMTTGSTDIFSYMGLPTNSYRFDSVISIKVSAYSMQRALICRMISWHKRKSWWNWQQYPAVNASVKHEFNAIENRRAKRPDFQIKEGIKVWELTSDLIS